MAARFNLALSFLLIALQTTSAYISKDSKLQTKDGASIVSEVASRGLIHNKNPTAAFAQAPNIVTPGICFCVTTGSCGSSTNDGSGLIDVRIVTNPSSSSGTLTPVSSGINPLIVNQNFCQSGLSLCCPSSGYSCGIRYPPVAGAPLPGAGHATFGSYPWQTVILGSNSVYVGSGALIDHLHVVTVAHKVAVYTSNGIQLKVRLGEWDASASSPEPIAAQEFFVTRIFIHPQFNAENLKNDIAIIRLGSAVPLGSTPTIGTVCLPSNQLSNTRCWVAGWGRNDFATGSYQAIMKEVDVPLVEQNTCQVQLRATRLGSNFNLDATSFMCAGGEAGKDACVGDGGAPLVCLHGGRWFVMSLVAWGIGCGTSNVPGVYVNLPNYVTWIQSAVRS